MGRLIKEMWQVFCEPFRIINDFMFGDAHHIVSKEGWRRLNNDDEKSLKQ